MLDAHLNLMTVAGDGANPGDLLKKLMSNGRIWLWRVTDRDDTNKLACISRGRGEVPRTEARVSSSDNIDESPPRFPEIGRRLLVNQYDRIRPGPVQRAAAARVHRVADLLDERVMVVGHVDPHGTSRCWAAS
jgi:hypothetical protein